MQHTLPALIVFLALIGATIWAWQSALESLRAEEDRVIQFHTSSTEQAIERRLRLYEENLRGAVGLLNGSENVTRADWRSYIESTGLAERIPGVRGIGYGRVVPAGSEEEFNTRVRAEPGFEDITISQPTGDPFGLSVPVEFIEPLDAATRSALGFNMYANDIRRKAMETARDTGEPTLTDKINLVNRSNPEANAAGFLLYMPHYATGMPTETLGQRRAAIQGFAYVTFRADDLFDAIFRDSGDDVGFEIYAGGLTNANLLYRNDDYERLFTSDNSYLYTSPISVEEAPFVIRYAISEDVISPILRDRPNNVLVTGLLADILISGFIFTLLLSRTRTLAAAKEHEVQMAKDDLLSLASHQLRTPATGVKQYLGMILEGYAGTIDDTQREFLRKAYDSNERQLTIINELLYVAKADAGRIVLTCQDVNLHSLLTDIVNEQKGSAIDKDIELTLSLPKKNITIYADKHSLHMALENLVNNAIKYTPVGGTVTVGARRAPGEIRVYVRDTGVGIKNEDIQTVFKQFSRVPNDLSAIAGGSGIGLYLSRHLIELHGGSINVTSKIGRGSVFTAHLPDRTAHDIIESRTATIAPQPEISSDQAHAASK